MYTIQTITPICRKLHAHKLRQQPESQACVATDHKLVLVTGFFDLLHSEHINFLQKAREEGDILIVAVESDTRARHLKGEGRPIETQSVRAKNLLSLTEPIESTETRKVVDFVILLPDNFNTPDAHKSLIQAVHPDILAVSSHTKHQEKKSQLVTEFGGKLVVVHLHNPAISTTKIIAKNQL